MSLALTALEPLAFNAHKFRGHVTLAMPLLEKFSSGHVRALPGNTIVKSEVRSFNRFWSY